MATPSLKLTYIAPKNGWLEDVCLSYWGGLFSVAMLVSGSVNQEFTTQLNFQDVSHLETWDSCQERPCFPSMHVKSV